MVRFTVAGSVAFILAASTATNLASVQDTRRATKTIKGSEHPELIPDDVAWLHFFIHFVNYARMDALPSEKFAAQRVESLSKYELRIPREDVLEFLRIADNALTKRRIILESAEGLTEVEAEAKNREVEQAILHARDEIKFRLPKRSADLLQYRADISRKRIEIDVPVIKK